MVNETDENTSWCERETNKTQALAAAILYRCISVSMRINDRDLCYDMAHKLQCKVETETRVLTQVIFL